MDRSGAVSGVALHAYDWAAIAAYFAVVVGAGLWFARYTKTTKDFFFGGQRFAWWLAAASMVARSLFPGLLR